MCNILRLQLYLLIEIRHNYLKQCHENYFEVEKHKLYACNLGALRGDFWEFGCPNDTQTPYWLRLWWPWSLYGKRGDWITWKVQNFVWYFLKLFPKIDTLSLDESSQDHPINVHRGQKQPDTSEKIFQAKAHFEK